MTSEIISIDGFGPIPTVRPNNLSELCEVVRSAAGAVYPVGGRTALHLGYTPSKPGVAVDTRGLSEVIDYPARDMTITVRSGITLAALDGILRAENQRLPIDVPLPDAATLGGAVACDISGPRRYGFGKFRDYVIGIGLVNDLGQEVKAGGRVVKNVAGYDLCKLYTGSLGMFGIISFLTLKLKPRPEDQAFLKFFVPADRLEATLDLVHRSTTRPVAVELLNLAATRDLPQELHGSNGFTLLIGFEEKKEAIDWQIPQIRKELQDVGGDIVARGSECDRLWASLRDWPQLPATVSLKANLRSSGLAKFVQILSQAAPDACCKAHAGNGIVHVQLRESTQEQISALLAQLRPVAAAADGSVIVTRCPPEWKASLRIWGDPRPDWPLMRVIKSQLDPNGRFNPGRFIDGEP